MDGTADERLIVMLEARIRDFEKNMAKAEARGTKTYQRLRRDSSSATGKMEGDMTRAAGRMNHSLASVGGQIGSLGKSFAGGLLAGGVAALATQLAGAARQAVSSLATIGDEAKRANLSAEDFQRWSFVADQNRIGIDALTDGFKELSLRADEFIQTGSGSAAESFKRLGFSATDLRERLKDPSELMLEIIKRLQIVDKAGQVRIADELLGGQGGEQFLQLLSKGEEGIRATMRRADELGVVLDEQVISRAQVIDSKFSALSSKIAAASKAAVVAVAQNVGLIGDIDEALGGEDAAKGQLGEDLRNALASNAQAAEAAQDDAEELARTYRDLSSEVSAAARAIAQEVPTLIDLGAEDAAVQLADIAGEMENLVTQIQNGEIPASELEGKMSDLISRAGAALEAAQGIDGVDLSNAVSAVDALSGALERAVAWAREYVSRMAAAAGVTVTTPAAPGRADRDQSGSEGRTDEGSPLAPRVSVRPRAAPALLGEPEPASTSGRSGGGGGGSDGFASAVASLEAETAALNAEAEALIASAAAGKDYGDAAEYARTRADLLTKAQEEGKTVTPELVAQIDKLAQAHVTAGMRAEEAAAKMERVREASQKGAGAIADIFMAAADGAESARAAVMSLLMEIARAQLNKVFMGLADSTAGGPLSWLGSLLSFDGGGDTGAGARAGGLDGRGGFLAMMHPQETVIDHTKPQQRAAASSAGGVQYVEVPYMAQVDVDDRGKLVARIERVRQEALHSTVAAARMQQRSLPNTLENLQRRGTT